MATTKKLTKREISTIITRMAAILYVEYERVASQAVLSGSAMTQQAGIQLGIEASGGFEPHHRVEFESLVAQLKEGGVSLDRKYMSTW